MGQNWSCGLYDTETVDKPPATACALQSTETISWLDRGQGRRKKYLQRTAVQGHGTLSSALVRVQENDGYQRAILPASTGSCNSQIKKLPSSFWCLVRSRCANGPRPRNCWDASLDVNTHNQHIVKTSLVDGDCNPRAREQVVAWTLRNIGKIPMSLAQSAAEAVLTLSEGGNDFAACLDALYSSGAANCLFQLETKGAQSVSFHLRQVQWSKDETQTTPTHPDRSGSPRPHPADGTEMREDAKASFGRSPGYDRLVRSMERLHVSVVEEDKRRDCANQAVSLFKSMLLLSHAARAEVAVTFRPSPHVALRYREDGSASTNATDPSAPIPNTSL